ncbi:hypothetical protein YC2023_077867 [Brassica napus]
MFAVLRLHHYCGSVGSVLGNSLSSTPSILLLAWGVSCSWACSGVTLRGSGLRERFFDRASCFSFGSFRSVGGSTVVRLVKTSSTTEQIYVRFSCVKARGTKDLWLCHPGSSILWRRVQFWPASGA